MSETTFERVVSMSPSYPAEVSILAADLLLPRRRSEVECPFSDSDEEGDSKFLLVP